MYRVVIFIIASVTILVGYRQRTDKEWFKSHVMNAMLCCDGMPESTFKLSMTDELRSCFEQSKDPVTCEREICIANIKGFATKDNEINMKKLKELIDDEFCEDTKLLEDVKTNCLNENFEKYAPSEYCNFTKMRHCVAVQMLSHCLEWHDNADCKEMKGFVEKCVKMSQ